MGIARLEAAGTALTLRTGKRAEIRGDDVRTGQALQDAFDSWAFARDRRDEAAIATRYIPSYVTGYEELDHYGSWTVNDDYGPLWAPRSVASGWSPYSDGRWAWVAPWGWTWVDNAPWGYAPFHYGRWVTVRNRWYWAPGRIVGRPVWAPALVGWVGGDGWSVAFNDRRHRPGLGWYPLTPRDRYVPHYHVTPDHERRLVWQHRGNNERWKNVQVRREGVTIVPREGFEGRRSVQVNTLPRASVGSNPGRLPVAAATVVPGFARAPDRNRDGIADRPQTGGSQINRPQIDRPQVNRLQTERDNDGAPDRTQVGRERESIADRVQADRNRDGTPDRLQGDRSRETITTNRLQTDRFQGGRDVDSVADRMQRERNEAPFRGNNVIVTERPRVERPQIERPQIDRPQVERPQVERPVSQPVFNAPVAQPAPQARPERPEPPPSRAFIQDERRERQREMMLERAEARRDESRREAAQRMSIQQPPPAAPPRPAPVAAPAPPPPVMQPRPAPVAQPSAPAPGPSVQPRGGRPDRSEGGRER